MFSIFRTKPFLQSSSWMASRAGVWLCSTVVVLVRREEKSKTFRMSNSLPSVSIDR